MLQFGEYIDSHETAMQNKAWLDISRDYAADLGNTAKLAAEHGFYYTDTGQKVVWGPQVINALQRRLSLPPHAPLPSITKNISFTTHIQVVNQTTLVAAKRLKDQGNDPLALNFASGTTPGGGFLCGAKAQEENLCRSSALFATLANDPMYISHRQTDPARTSDWVILSPDVPVFRHDNGDTLDQPWTLSFITCAAPIAKYLDRDEARMLLKKRIYRVLEVAAVHGYTSLVLGAWGCGAFGNDPASTAFDLREALETAYDGVFNQVVFAITDWSDERKFIGPFKEVFAHST